MLGKFYDLDGRIVIDKSDGGLLTSRPMVLSLFRSCSACCALFYAVAVFSVRDGNAGRRDECEM